MEAAVSEEMPESGPMPGPDDMADSYEKMSAISYQAVSTGLPVVTHSGKQFGVVEHVLEVPELDVFDGIVVYTGTGLGALHPHDGRGGEEKARAEMLRVGQRKGWLRFVDADQVEVITPGYVKCTFGDSEVALLPEPEGAPVFHVDMAREDRAARRVGYSHMYGGMFSRPRWKRS
jgi:hypothetical protein